MTLNELFARFDKLAWVSKHHRSLIKALAQLLTLANLRDYLIKSRIIAHS